MKKMIALTLGVVLLGSVCFSSARVEDEKGNAADPSVTVFCSPDLMPLAGDWVSEYGRLNPEAGIRLLDIQGGNLETALKSGPSMGLVSGVYLNGNQKGELWKEVVGREVVVGVMNPGNPMAEMIQGQGISPSRLSAAISGSASWEVLLAGGQSKAVTILITGEEDIPGRLGAFLKKDAGQFKVRTVESPSALAEALKADPYAIGFCPLNAILDPATHQLSKELVLLPIDKNGNGQMDSFEKIYVDKETFIRGIWVGKYPQELITGIYAVALDKPVTPAQKSFMKWVLTGGQQGLEAGGYACLALGERQARLEELNEAPILPRESGPAFAGFKAALIILMVALLIGLVVEGFVLYRRYSHEEAPAAPTLRSAVFSEDGVRAPAGLFYDKSHTWAFMEKDGQVRVGVDDFLPHVTGGLTSLRMKNPGDKVKKGEANLTIIRSGKQLTVKSPVSGIIAANNKALINNAALLNSAPYSDGWVYMIEPSNWLREIQFMFLADKFREWLNSEFIRLKDFLAFLQKAHQPQYAHVVLQDGGEIREGVLQDLGPEAWEDFQQRFMEQNG